MRIWSGNWIFRSIKLSPISCVNSVSNLNVHHDIYHICILKNVDIFMPVGARICPCMGITVDSWARRSKGPLVCLLFTVARWEIKIIYDCGELLVMTGS